MITRYDEERTARLDVWRERVEIARSESCDAYSGVLDPLFVYHPESLRIAETNDRQSSAPPKGLTEDTRLASVDKPYKRGICVPRCAYPVEEFTAEQNASRNCR